MKDDNDLGWHFNRSKNAGTDTRIEHLKFQYEDSIRMLNNNITDTYAVSYFGMGLHAMQDIFAHQGYYTNKDMIPFVGGVYPHYVNVWTGGRYYGMKVWKKIILYLITLIMI